MRGPQERLKENVTNLSFQRMCKSVNARMMHSNLMVRRQVLKQKKNGGFEMVYFRFQRMLITTRIPTMAMAAIMPKNIGV